MLLIKFQTNLPNELEINGWRLMPQEEYKNILSLLHLIDEYFEIELGDSAFLEYQNGSALINDLYFSKISKEQEETLIKLFDYQYGFFPDVMGVINDHLSEEIFNKDIF